jgi:transcription antitermination factor NusG
MDHGDGIWGMSEWHRDLDPLLDIVEVFGSEMPYEMPYVDLLDQVEQHPQAAGGVLLEADVALVDSAYDYSAVRLEIPWQAPGLPRGRIRLDFAHEGDIGGPPVCPILTLIPRSDGGKPIAVRTASREMSLAWKILWLHIGAQSAEGALGKDLYDAVLLAEDNQTRLSHSHLRKVLNSHLTASETDFHPRAVRTWTVAWDSFRTECPWVQGSAEDWQDRLIRALESMFATTKPEMCDVKIGDMVAINGGPFADVPVIITEIQLNRNTVSGSIHMLGQETRVEIPFDNIRQR